MLKKLAGYPRQNPVARALREIGRVERSLFMLDWLDDPDLRRRTSANLNKGEARNALARAVFFNRLGELRDRTFENQRHRASGLNLVASAKPSCRTSSPSPSPHAGRRRRVPAGRGDAIGRAGSYAKRTKGERHAARRSTGVLSGRKSAAAGTGVAPQR